MITAPILISTRCEIYVTPVVVVVDVVVVLVVEVVGGALSSTCATLMESRSTTADWSGVVISSANSALFGLDAPDSKI